jgi:dTDP-4-amino-4,6-dideoxygalactose transaminase
MNVPFVNYGQQYLDHKEEYDEAMQRCLTKGKLILQEDVEEFEQNLAAFVGMKYAVGLANGTDALFLALKAKQNLPDSMNVTDYTFKATHEAIHHAGYIPLRHDINPVTRMPDGDMHIPVHIEGMVSHSENAIIEDACQAFGAKGVGYSGTACFSFYPAKIFGSFGDAGAIATNDQDVYDLVKLYRHHWQTGTDEQYAYNSRLDNVNAAFLNVKFKYIKDILNRREQLAKRYNDGLKDTPLGLPYDQEGRVWQDYVVTTPQRETMVAYLKENGIGVLGYGMTPNYEAMNCISELPNTKKLYNEMFRLPLNETLTDEQVDYVIATIKKFYELHTM